MSSSIIEDFSHIAAELKKIEEEKEKQKSADRDKPIDWTAIENVYGYPNNSPPDLTAVTFCAGEASVVNDQEFLSMRRYLESFWKPVAPMHQGSDSGISFVDLAVEANGGVTHMTDDGLIKVSV